MPTRRARRAVTTVLGIVLLMSASCSNPLHADRPAKATIGALAAARTSLHRHREQHGRWPSTLEEVGRTVANETRDGWGGSLAYVVTGDGAHCLLLSAGSDGKLETELGGPTAGRGHDIVLWDGNLFHYPDEHLDLFAAVDPRAPADREAARSEWLSPQNAALRQAHADFVRGR